MTKYLTLSLLPQPPDGPLDSDSTSGTLKHKKSGLHTKIMSINGSNSMNYITIWLIPTKLMHKFHTFSDITLQSIKTILFQYQLLFNQANI